jgi:hypothetical protein
MADKISIIIAGFSLLIGIVALIMSGIALKTDDSKTNGPPGPPGSPGISGSTGSSSSINGLTSQELTKIKSLLPLMKIENDILVIDKETIVKNNLTVQEKIALQRFFPDINQYRSRLFLSAAPGGTPLQVTNESGGYSSIFASNFETK